MKPLLPTLLISSCLASLTAASAVAAEKSPKAVIAPVPDVWTLPLLGTGVKSNDVYTDGHVYLNLPLWSTIGSDGTLGGSYLFMEPYTSVGEGGETASSLGIGFRHLFNDQPVSALEQRGQAAFLEEGWYFGGSLFVDMLRTSHRNEFWQLGLGAEIGTRYVELRGNYYLPLEGGRKAAGSQVDRQTFSSSSTQHRTSLSSAGDPLATGNLVYQDATYTTMATTTTRTTTLTRTTNFYERGMEGWDIEAGVLIPGLDEHLDVTLIAGYASMENQPFGPQERGTGPIRGWRAGLEVRPVPAVVLTAMWHENKAFTGSDWSAGIELQIPLDRTWKDAFRPRRRHLVERMAEPVRRQNAAIRLSHSAETKTKSQTSVKRVTRVVSQSTNRIVLEDDIVFVNNGAPVGNGIQAGNDATGNGTAEAPMATVQAGADIAQASSNGSGRVWNVYTQGTAAGYAEDPLVDAGSVHFIGSGRSIRGVGGKAFGSGPAPRVQGAFWAENVPFFGMTGYQVEQSVGSGLRAINVSRVVVEGNQFSNATSSSVWIHGQGLNQIQALVTANTFDGSADHAVRVDTVDSSHITAIVSQNVITGGEQGIGAFAYDSSTIDYTASQNRITGVAEHGIDLEAHVSASLEAALSGNLVQGAGLRALNIHGFGDSEMVVAANHNTFRTPVLHGAHLTLEDTSDLTVTFTANTFNSPGVNGVRVEATGINDVDVYLYENAFLGSGQHQVYANSGSNSNLAMNIHDNTFSNATGSAIMAETDGIAVAGFSVRRNSITNQGDHGIHVLVNGGLNVYATIVDNRITGDAGFPGNGVMLESHDAVTLATTISGNVIALMADGIHLSANGTSTLDATLEDNLLVGNRSSAVRLEAHDSATLTPEVQDNQILGSTNVAMALVTENSGTMTATLSGNTISNTTSSAMLMESQDTSVINVSVTNNVITNAGSAALWLSGLDTSLLQVVYEGNSVSGVGQSGSAAITIEEGAGTTTVNGLINNVIDPSPSASMLLDSIGTPTGTFIINGVNVILPVDLP